MLQLKAEILNEAVEEGKPWSVSSIPAASNLDSREAQVFEEKKQNLDGLGHWQKRGVFSGDSGGGGHHFMKCYVCVEAVWLDISSWTLEPHSLAIFHISDLEINYSALQVSK